MTVSTGCCASVDEDLYATWATGSATLVYDSGTDKWSTVNPGGNISGTISGFTAVQMELDCLNLGPGVFQWQATHITTGSGGADFVGTGCFPITGNVAGTSTTFTQGAEANPAFEIRITDIKFTSPPLPLHRYIAESSRAEDLSSVGLSVADSLQTVDTREAYIPILDSASTLDTLSSGEIRDILLEVLAVADLMSTAREGRLTEILAALENLSMVASTVLRDSVSLTDALKGGLNLEDLLAVLDALRVSPALQDWLSVQDNTRLWFSIAENILLSDEISFSIPFALADTITLVYGVYLEASTRFSDQALVSESMSIGLDKALADAVQVLDSLVMSINLLWWDFITVSDLLSSQEVHIIMGCAVTLLGGDSPVVLVSPQDISRLVSDGPVNLDRC